MKKLKLVAVSKNRNLSEILEMLQKTRIKRLAENRLEEAEKKFPNLPKNLEKHYIGKLQSRKIKKICGFFDTIQSVENLEQAKKIASFGKKKIMLQINISNLRNRSGSKLAEAKKLIKQIQEIENIELVGVMGMASPDSKKARSEFRMLKNLQGNLKECSMGMSSDYKIAIEEGSTMLRLGKILFEEGLPIELNYE